MMLPTWTINVTALKRNVFFSLSDPTNKIKKILTPGSMLRSGVRRDEYNKLNDNKDRRKKRSWRMFINNQKKTPPACAQAWKLLYDYILDQKLKSQKFVLILSGTNLKLGKSLGRNIIQKSFLSISHILVKQCSPHNGCPIKIKKRKKNKGRNRRIKRSLNTTNKKLPKVKNFVTVNSLPSSYYMPNQNSTSWLQTKLIKIIGTRRNQMHKK